MIKGTLKILEVDEFTRELRYFRHNIKDKTSIGSTLRFPVCDLANPKFVADLLRRFAEGIEAKEAI